MLEWPGRDHEPPVLDHDYLDRLGLHLGPAALAELITDGLIEIADRLHRLAELACTPDDAATARFAHDLVGVAGNLGLSALAASAAELQRAARDGDRSRLPGLLATLQAAGAAGEAALREALAGLSGT